VLFVVWCFLLWFVAVVVVGGLSCFVMHALLFNTSHIGPCGAPRAVIYKSMHDTLGFRASYTTQHNTTQHNTTQHDPTQHNTTQHNTTQHHTTQQSATPHNTTTYNTTLHATNHKQAHENTQAAGTRKLLQWHCQSRRQLRVVCPPCDRTQQLSLAFFGEG
jgi:hypothetical protein